MFRAFAHGGYLRFWVANFLSSTPRWMQLTLVMIMAREEMRGRALGVVSLAIGAGPLGSLVLGALADAISPVFALRIHALLGMIMLALTVLVLPVIMDRTERATP